ncbi:MAG TPA: hypothetical protein VGD79_02990 [Thermoanaerobaculia bacterium]|jgi:hypothetical protein
MSEKEKENIGVSAVTPNPHAETAQERVVELRKWREQVPRFAIPASGDLTRKLSPAASVPPEFIEITNMAVANENVLVRGEGATPTEIRDLVAYADAFDPVADELEALATFLRYSTTAARHTAGTEALTTYSLAQRLAKQPKYGRLTPYVASMRRALGRAKRLTAEEAAQQLAERAAKAAAKVAAKAAKLKPRVTTPAQ